MWNQEEENDNDNNDADDDATKDEQNGTGIKDHHLVVRMVGEGCAIVVYLLVTLSSDSL